MQLHQALQAGRWLSFFRSLAAAPYLAACLGNMYSHALRESALQTLVKGLGELYLPLVTWQECHVPSLPQEQLAARPSLVAAGLY